MSRMWTFEKAKDFVRIESAGNCELLSVNRKHNRDYMTIRCVCGNIFDTLYYRFKDGKHMCNSCSGYEKYSVESLKKYVSENSDCELLSDTYKNNSSTLFFKCICGSKFETTLKRFKIGKKQCDGCTNEFLAAKFSKSHIDFVKEVFEAVGNEYSVVSDYKNRKTKVKLKHKECGCEWFANPSDFLHKDSRCPQCNESKGERAIRDWLTSKNISFEQEFRFGDCVNQRSLPFDFAIFEGDKLTMLIEYDGKQHYIRGCFGIDQYESIKTNDRIKTEYCKKNKIKLIRIPYTKFKNISTILEDALL